MGDEEEMYHSIRLFVKKLKKRFLVQASINIIKILKAKMFARNSASNSDSLIDPLCKGV